MLAEDNQNLQDDLVHLVEHKKNAIQTQLHTLQGTEFLNSVIMSCHGRPNLPTQ
jgi:hypothetical protein